MMMGETEKNRFTGLPGTNDDLLSVERWRPNCQAENRTGPNDISRKSLPDSSGCFARRGLLFCNCPGACYNQFPGTERGTEFIPFEERNEFRSTT
jgi:hypothetical protein